MDADLKTLVEESLRLSKENNKMLRSMRRAAVFGFFVRIIFWLTILGVPVYLYVVYLAPVVSSVFPNGATNVNPVLKMFGIPSTDVLRQSMQTLSNFFNSVASIANNVPKLK